MLTQFLTFLKHTCSFINEKKKKKALQYLLGGVPKGRHIERLFIYLFIYGHAWETWKLTGQGSNPSHNCDPQCQILNPRCHRGHSLEGLLNRVGRILVVSNLSFHLIIINSISPFITIHVDNNKTQLFSRDFKIIYFFYQTLGLIFSAQKETNCFSLNFNWLKPSFISLTLLLIVSHRDLSKWHPLCYDCRGNFSGLGLTWICPKW